MNAATDPRRQPRQIPGGIDQRSFLFAVLVPTILFFTTQSASMTVLPLVAIDRGSGLAGAAMIAGTMTLGTLLGNIPTGRILSLVGERIAMMGAAAINGLGLLTCWLSPNPALLALGALFIGLATPIFMVARQTLVTKAVPVTHRARVMSLVAGSMRVGMLAGPFAALAATTQWDAGAAFAVALPLTVAGFVLVAVLPLPDGIESPAGAKGGQRVAPAGLIKTLRDNRHTMVRLGAVPLVFQAMRLGRSTLIPLWGVSIGLTDSRIALFVGIAAAVDLALFYPAGILMDRVGRVFVGILSLSGFTLGMATLAVTGFGGWESTWAWATAAVVLGAANGISSGIVAVMGSDLADPDHPAAFLSAWQFISNVGSMGAPLAIAGLTAVASLSAAAVTVGASGVIGALVMARFGPRFLAGPGTHRG